MHGDRLIGTGAQVGIVIIVAGCAAHIVAIAAAMNATAATQSPRKAIVDDSRWIGWIQAGFSDDDRQGEEETGFIRRTVGKNARPWRVESLGNGGGWMGRSI
jgi:hypothetical protein